MDRHGRRRVPVSSLLSLCVVLCFGSLVAADLSASQPNHARATVAGRVIDGETRTPLRGVPVCSPYEVTYTDESGRFRLAKAPPQTSFYGAGEPRHASAQEDEALDAPGAGFPLAAFSDGRVALAFVDLQGDDGLDLYLGPMATDRVDPYCVVCHKRNPRLDKDLWGRPTRTPGQGAQVEPVPWGNRTSAWACYQDSHPKGMNMVGMQAVESRSQGFKKPKRLALHEGKFVTCDTCHTRHKQTGRGSYAVLSYEGRSDLCHECHL
jgi:hypothetical protein